MRIERVDQPGKEWDTFAQSQPDVRVGHASAWAAVFRDAYKLRSASLMARDDDGAPCGILSLAHFRTVTGRRELISLPYLDGSGILARDAEVQRALHDAALELARSSGAGALELRQYAPLAHQPPADALDRVNLAMKLEEDVDGQWKALRAKVRNQTRKAEKEGLTLMEGGSPDQLLDAYFGPFQENMRDLGSPVHARAFFAAAQRHFGDRLRLVVALHGDRPVGGLVAIHYGHSVTVPWASTLRSERRRCPNNLIYWEAIRWAIERGARHFDFGRSPKESGTHRFKVGWGAQEETLNWLRTDAAGSAFPMTVGQSSPAMTKVSEIWTRLPVPVASFLGSRLRRYFSN